MPKGSESQSRCPNCGQIKRRSSAQNARLHKLFTELAANVKAKDGLYHPAMWWKVVCKDRWLGYDEFHKPDGSTVYVMKSTSDLDVEELNKFMAEVELFANQRGVYLDD